MLVRVDSPVNIFRAEARRGRGAERHRKRAWCTSERTCPS